MNPLTDMLIPTEIDQAKQHRALMIQQRILALHDIGKRNRQQADYLQMIAIDSYCRRITGE